jgi:hypothetical protein
MALAKPLVREDNVVFNLHPMPHILAFPGDMVQIWLNLIKNALEALQESNTQDPVILITAKSYDEAIHVVIQDNGPGIPKEDIDRIFQPNVSSKVHGLAFGLGLGLTVVQRIVTAYNGTIRAESEPGNTRFIVQIPLTPTNR